MTNTLSDADQDLVKRYNRGVTLVESALVAVTPEELDRRDEDQWSARMVVHHLADSETNSYLRLRRLLVEPAPTLIQGYDEAAWAANSVLGYETLDIESSLAVFRSVRAASSLLLSRIDASDLDREGTHTESGPYTLRFWLKIYAEHAEQHAQQIERARGATP